MVNKIKELKTLFKNNKQKIIDLEKNIYNLELKLFEKLNIKTIKLDNKLKFEVKLFCDNFIINIFDLKNKNFEDSSLLNIYIKNKCKDIHFCFNFSNSSKEYIKLYSFILDCIKDYSLDRLDYSSFSKEYSEATTKLDNLKLENSLLEQKIENLNIVMEIKKINNVLYYIEEEKAIEFYHSLIEDKETKKIKIVYFNILNDIYSFKEQELVINFFSCSKPKIKLINNGKNKIIDENKFLDICKKQFYFNNKLVTDLSTVSFLCPEGYASIKQIYQKLSPNINANKF